MKVKLIAAGIAALTLITNAAVMQPVLTGPSSITASAEGVIDANVLISRDVPAYADNGNASDANDEAYYTQWSASSGSYLAYDLSGVPASQRKQVIAVWYNLSSFDNLGAYVSKSDEPIDYVIEVNSAAGGTYPSDGWEIAETVTGNMLSTRQHLIKMEGYNWIRIRVTKAENDRVTMNFDVHDASNGVTDSWIFFGDSITAGGMGNAYGKGFATHVHEIDSDYFPVQQNGGIGGILSSDGKEHIEEWLDGCPANFVSIAYGTNDCWNNPNNLSSYYSNTKYMIDAILAAGKTPVLPMIPYSSNAEAGKYTADYNAKVEQLYAEYGDKLVHGPDFYTFFKDHPDLLSGDGVHPSSEGYAAMRKVWAETMYETVYKGSAPLTPTVTVKGDVNNDGKFDVADVVLFQKWLLAVPDTHLANWKAADFCNDNELNVFDMCMMKRELISSSSQPDTDAVMFYEAEDAKISGGNSVMSESSASGGKVVGNFAEDADVLTFNVNIPADGCYDLNFVTKGIGSEKTNYVLVDGEQVGTIQSAEDEYGNSVLRSVTLSAGKHAIAIQKFWGWMTVDSLEITPAETISDDIYNVSDTLINKNADANTQKLFSYLCDSYGKYTLSGQVCDGGIDGTEFNAIKSVTGKYPAILGLDMMDYVPSRTAKGAKSVAVDKAIEFDAKGGIVEFCWHWNAPDKYMKDGVDDNGNPRWWSAFSTSNTTFDIEAVMNGEDEEGKALLDEDIKEIAKQLNRLQDAGVPVLWRPLHEASGGWFWWGAKGPDAYKKLWSYLYDQLTNVYGCNNLIWVWNGQSADWYPGNDYVDIVGEDIYAGAHNYGPQNAKFSEILEYTGGKKIIALTENGTVPDIDKMIATNAKWAWFGTWSGEFVVNGSEYSEAYTSKEILKKAYDSDYVITLDELSWK